MVFVQENTRLVVFSSQRRRTQDAKLTRGSVGFLTCVSCKQPFDTLRIDCKRTREQSSARTYSTSFQVDCRGRMDGVYWFISPSTYNIGRYEDATRSLRDKSIVVRHSYSFLINQRVELSSSSKIEWIPSYDIHSQPSWYLNVKHVFFLLV